MKNALIISALLCSVFYFGQENIYHDHNGKPLSGTINTETLSTTYKNGKMQERIQKDEYTGSNLIIEKFDHEGPISIEYLNLKIKNKPQKSYVGLYQQGKKYDGYFLGEVFIDNYKTLEFYEKGVLKFTYSFDYLKRDQDIDGVEYDIESEMRDGKVYHGLEYQLLNQNTFLRTHYKDGAVSAFDLDIFAMHYFNRISVFEEKGKLTVKELEREESLLITKENQTLKLEKLDASKNVVGKALLESKDLRNTQIIYYVNNNQLHTFHINNPHLYGEYPNFLNIFINLFYSFKGNNNRELLKYMFSQFKSSLIDFNSEMDQGYPFKEKDAIISLTYDNQGKPYNGCQINEIENGYTFEVYKQGIKKRTGNVKNIVELKTLGEELLSQWESN